MNMNLKNSKALAVASVALFVLGAVGKTEAASPDKQIEFIGPCEDIIHEGGALHCVTWNILADPAPITLEEA